MGKSTTHAIEHEALAVVLQVRRDELQVLLWKRARAPFEGEWAERLGRWRPPHAYVVRFEDRGGSERAIVIDDGRAPGGAWASS